MAKRDPNFNPNWKADAERERQAEREAQGVPKGKRSKCTACGAVDKSKLVGKDRKRRCLYCASTIKQRRAPHKPNILSYVVSCQLNGKDWSIDYRDDRFAAEQIAFAFVEGGPCARTRYAQIVELLDNGLTGNSRVLKYENYKQRRTSVQWDAGCESCKGKGIVPVMVRPGRVDDQGVVVKAVIKFLPCGSCNGLGGELTRVRAFGRAL